MKVKNLYMVGRRIIIRSGNIARVWVDSIGDQKPFKDQFPQLFSICNFPECIVEKCREADPVTFFRRRLSNELKEQWQQVAAAARGNCVSDESDCVKWGLGPKKVFTTKSVYSFLERNIT